MLVSARVVLIAAFTAGLAAGCSHAPAPAAPAPSPSPAPGAAAPTPAAPQPDARAALRPVAGEAPALLDDGDAASLREALGRSLAWLGGQPPERELAFGPHTVTAARLREALTRLDAFLAGGPSPAALAAYVAREFEVLESVGGDDGRVLVTGYYEPMFPGSLTPSAEYPVPVYGLPADRVQAELGAFAGRLEGERVIGRVEGARLVPYYTRSEIQQGRALAGRGLEIAWMKDPVDLFFIEVQGSGALKLPDGAELRIGYAGANGHPYRSIGRLLIDEGRASAEQMSMQWIRRYLREHPDEVARVLGHNASFVFFRPRAGPPEGNLGQPVTPRRSIATDQRLFPPAALAFLATTRPQLGPAGAALAGAPITRFVFNQDTGGALRGPGRVDFFWGRGEEANEMAGLMKQPGRLLVLVPKAR